MITEPWGLTHAWDPTDPDRPCFTCGGAPTGRFRDGSPRYGHDHQPIVLPDNWAPILPVRLAHTLNAGDLERARLCGQQRHDKSARRDKWKDKALDTARRLANDTLGAEGEIAFARLTGLPWKCLAGRGYGKPDVGRYGVRTRRRDGLLPIHTDDTLAMPFVLMREVGPHTYRLIGWVERAGACHRIEWMADPGDRNPAYWVPDNVLNDPRSLPELAATIVAARDQPHTEDPAT